MLISGNILNDTLPQNCRESIIKGECHHNQNLLSRFLVAMGEEQLGWGDQNTADIKFHLIDLEGPEYGGNLV